MKKINSWFWLSLLIFVTIEMVACSSEEVEVLPEFPTTKIINTAAS